MNIHVCARCEGSGHVAGGYGWEVPWTRWATDAERAGKTGLLEPQPCPDCAGTGALLEVKSDDAAAGLPMHRYTRRGYAEHVAAVLNSQRYRRGPARGA